MKQLTIRTPNDVGALANVCEKLGSIGVNMESVTGHGDNNRGLIRIITADEQTARKAVESLGYEVTVDDIITFKIPHRPGELGKATRRLAKSGVNIESIYLLYQDADTAEFAVRTDQMEKAREVLKKWE